MQHLKSKHSLVRQLFQATETYPPVASPRAQGLVALEPETQGQKFRRMPAAHDDLTMPAKICILPAKSWTLPTNLDSGPEGLRVVI